MDVLQQPTANGRAPRAFVRTGAVLLPNIGRFQLVIIMILLLQTLQTRVRFAQLLTPQWPPTQYPMKFL